MVRGILTVGGWTLASRVLGLFRDILIAALAGAGPVADAFLVANKLPNIFRRLFGEGAFNAAFVPSFAAVLHNDGPDAARGFAEEAIAALAFWLVGITIAAELFMPALMYVVAPGFADNPEKFALAVDLARITFPYMPLICLAALLSGVLNAMERFAAAAASQVLYNVISMVCMVGLLGLLPTIGHALAWGVSISGVVQLLLLAWAVRRAGFKLHIPRPRMTPRMRLLLRRMAPGLVGAGVVQLNSQVDGIIASWLAPGTVAVLYFAERVNQLPLGIIGTAVGTAILPTLTRQVALAEPEAAIGTLNRAIEYALMLTIPAALALIVLARPIIGGLFGHGAFSEDAVVLSGQALAAFATGLPAFVLVKVLVPGFFARGDTTIPVRIGLVSVGINLALNLALMVPLQHLGPPLASSISSWFNAVALAVLLHRRGQLAMDARLLRVVPRMLAAALVMAAVLVAGQFWAMPAVLALHLPGARQLALAAMIAAGLAAYGAAGEALRAFSLRETIAAFARRRRRVKPA